MEPTLHMKRHLTLLLALMGLIPAFIAKADMKGSCGKNLTWNLDRDGVLTISGSGPMDSYSKASLPWRLELVKYVIFPEGMTTISANVFNGSKIQIANLPSTIQKIDKSAFKDCKNLTSVTLPYGLTEIGDAAFKDCRNLIKIQIPSSVKIIGKHAFQGCRLISAIGIPVNAESVGIKVFDGCKSLESVTALPAYISTTNCNMYGLRPALVEDYHKEMANHKKTTAPTSSSIASVPETTDIAVGKQSRKNTANPGIKYGESDIDKNIPVNPAVNHNTFAFIIANEKYTTMPDVPFANNDGRSFATYCHSTLGIPESNINVYYNATYGNMRAVVEYMKQIDEAFKSDVSFIFYYAGHGAPNEKTNEAYLIPADAYEVNESYCYPLKTLYDQLGSLKAKSVKVFMDACFSGVDRGNEMLAQGGRLVATVPKKAALSGNVIVISATSNDQAAWQYAPQGHGLFTYCLIKKLQESQGQVSMGELSDYLQEQVPRISIVHNRVTQTPTSQSSARLGTRWRLWQVTQ